jgi:L-ascorbate metabolism protein UlaG (beta-lactamase superfamily)
MKKIMLSAILSMSLCAAPAMAGNSFEKDTIKTAGGDLIITFIGHGTLMMEYGGKTIHIDPFNRLADYSQLPPADIIFLTHHHRDHLDLEALKHISTNKTVIVMTEKCAEQVENGITMKNGETRTVGGIEVRAVPAYNLVHRRDNGQLFHPKGEGNGYVLTFAEKNVYIAGDTENTPEMKALKNIDYAFLPMNLPYTMTPEMVADAVQAFRPKVLYPYHYGETDTSKVVALLQNVEGVEVRIRKMP